MGYDLYRIGADNIFGDCGNLGENLGALAMDAGGLLIPFASGGGAALRASRYADDAAEAAARAANKADTGCFVEGTPVETADGLVPIDQVQQGDLVWAKDPETGVSALREVTRTYVRHDIPVLALEFATGDGVSEVLTTTAEHPFWVKHQGFVPAEKLMPGDEVFTSMGGWVRVQSGTWLADTRTVYNLEVDDFHTYFVGQVGAWVHNACIWTKGKSGSSVKNAYNHWKKHGDEFSSIGNSKQYVDRARSFVSSPPPGALQKTRSNGDIVVYEQATNTFAVGTKNGVPKTMFKPDPSKHGHATNLDYFHAQ